MFLPKLTAKLEKLELKDMFNEVECSLNYGMPPDRTAATCPLRRCKKEKEQFKILVCRNADVFEKVFLMIIDTAARPRPFKKQTGNELGFEFHNSKKVQMANTIF